MGHDRIRSFPDTVSSINLHKAVIQIQRITESGRIFLDSCFDGTFHITCSQRDQ